MVIYLYHKRHLKTNLNYFGKTTGNPYTYKGSGVYWNNHLRKHGNEVETIAVWEFNNLDECSNFAIEFSKTHDIVKSTNWANLCVENGLDGGDKFTCMDPIKLADVNKRKSLAHTEIWKTRDKNLQAVVTSSIWATRDQSIINTISNKISKTLLDKTPEQRAETLRRRRETESKRLPIVCPHCNKVGKSLSNMKRYHLDKCKFISL
jgi:hypothetical protein